METAQSTIVVPADAGTVLNAFGDTVQLKLTGEQSNGATVVFVATVPPGGGPPPHIHHNEDELFFVLDGQFRFLVDDQWTDPQGAGTFVYSPRGVRHSFQNVGDTPSRFLGMATPSGFDQFFTKCCDIFAQSVPPDMARILAVSAEHGIEYVPALTAPPHDAPI